MGPEARKKLLKRYNGHCAYCGCELTEETMTVDHFIPRSKLHGKPDRDKINNFVPACRVCNHVKSNQGMKQMRMYFRNTVNGFLKRAGYPELLAREFKFYFEQPEFTGKLPQARKLILEKQKKDAALVKHQHAEIKKVKAAISAKKRAANSELGKLQNKIAKLRTSKQKEISVLNKKSKSLKQSVRDLRKQKAELTNEK